MTPSYPPHGAFYALGIACAATLATVACSSAPKRERLDCRIEHVMSCFSTPPKFCTEYAKDGAFCSSETYTASCPTDGLVGSCRVRRENWIEQVIRYYPDYTPAKAEAHCDALKGSFCPAERSL